MKYRFAGIVQMFALISVLSSRAWAQEVSTPERSSASSTTRTSAIAKPEHSYQLQPGEDPENRLISPFLKHLAGDQKEFWTTPTRFKVKDLKWIAPALGVTAAFIASDGWMSRQVNPNHVQTSLHISDYSTYSLIGLSGASFLFGHMTHNDHLQEAALLSGEAAVNSTAVTYLLKGITERQRPLEGNGHGDFFHGGASFPSEHAAIAWSVASVWAHEYPGWFSQMAAYGLASTVTITRVTAKQHFPTDVIVGSALGWYFGRQVYRAHHDPELGGSGWGSLIEEKTGEGTRNPDNMASPYVLVDSWVYPAIERLAAMGYVRTATLDIRPWTRMECARLVEEAGERLTDAGGGEGEAAAIHTALDDEFKDEIARRNGAPNVGAKLESIYTRTTDISGTPLRDSFHFGQTIINDYGRPYWTGFNDVSGVTGWAVAGPFSLYMNGEYQHSPAVPSVPAQTLQAEASADTVPFISPNPIPQINRFRLLDANASFRVSNVQFTFGQQSLWLGPTSAGPLVFTNNAEPLPMFRVDSVSPYQIPGLSRLLGPVHTQFFLGRLSGQQWSADIGPGLPSQPWLHGTKMSFRPTENLEFSLGYTAQFGGTGNPFTWHSFLRSFYSHTASVETNPGKRLGEFDFSYRVPGLRNWLTLYVDSMVIDEYSPIGSTRPQINPGVYLPRLPKLHNLQLRFEGVTTDLNIPSHFGIGSVYSDIRYRSGYTNNGFLLGNWVGRQGRAEQAWATYSFSPRSQIQFGYRHNNVDKAFLQGGDLQDATVRADVMLRHDLGVSGFVQYESWNFPVLSPTAKTNVTSSIQVTFWPNWTKNKQ
ncbi:MAG: phosphatase PAP2 family protein [Acidobacteriia bacterium]|nr:phosphatase PAP2 family protein [Terriglobia bacterium]